MPLVSETFGLLVRLESGLSPWQTGQGSQSVMMPAIKAKGLRQRAYEWTAEGEGCKRERAGSLAVILAAASSTTDTGSLGLMGNAVHHTVDPRGCFLSYVSECVQYRFSAAGKRLRNKTFHWA